MEIIVESFPFVFGILLGVTWARMGGPAARRVPWASAAIALGVFATLASGEWKESAL